MYAVKVHWKNHITGEKVVRYLHFQTYDGATNCIFTLQGREPGEYSPEDYFEIGKLYTEPKGEILNRESIETDWTIVYDYKTIK